MIKFKFTFIIAACFICLSGCGIRSEKERLQLKEQQLNEKEKQLSYKEQELNILEASLNEKQKAIDSVMSLPDTLSANYAKLTGSWQVKMVCTEAGCPGYAIGDTKVEQWILGFSNNKVIVQALNNKKQLLRVYSGYITADASISLMEQINTNDSAANPATRTSAILKPSKDGIMNGERTLIHSDNCKVLYSLDLRKQS